MKPPLIVSGPTGAGKSAFAMAIAERYGATLVSMDAMHVYRGMDIGTNKPSRGDRLRVRHVGIDIRNPDEDYSAAEFLKLAEAEADAGPVVLCGGTPFYLRAWLLGLVSAPAGDPALRAELERLEDPHAALAAVDPVLAARLHPHDRVRVLRGLEVFRLSGVPLSTIHAQDPQERREGGVIWIDRPDLDRVIDGRVLTMMDAGYAEEVRQLMEAGYGPQHKPMRSLGYRHLVDWLSGKSTEEDAIRLTQRDTRRYARKQRTFLRGLGLTPCTDPEAAVRGAWGT